MQPTNNATGLVYHPARTCEEVEQAWSLVYAAYRRTGLIDPNPHEIHTVPQAVGPHTLVTVGRHNDVIASTLSTYLDQPAGLPLDAIYADELNALRQQGRKLCEYGLFADRRESMTRSRDSIFELMRYAYYFAIFNGCDDGVIGVHPHHVPFYTRLIGFDVAGPEKSYATVKDNPAVLLRLDFRVKPFAEPLQRGLRYFLDRPLCDATFEQCFDFHSDAIANSRIVDFIERSHAR